MYEHNQTPQGEGSEVGRRKYKTYRDNVVDDHNHVIFRPLGWWSSQLFEEHVHIHP